MGLPAALQPGRRVDQLHLRRRGRRQRLGDAARRERGPPGDEGGLPRRQQRGLDARREVPDRQEALLEPAFARLGRDVALRRRPRREGRAAHRAADRAEGRRRAGDLAGRAVALLQPRRHGREDLRVQQGPEPAALRDPPRRSRVGARGDAHEPARRRRAAGAQPRRQEPRLRASRSSQDRAHGARPGVRRRAPALRRALGRPDGDLGDLRRVPGLRVDPRRPLDRRRGARQDRPRRRRQRRGEPDPLRGRGRAGGRRRPARPPRARRRDLPGEGHPLAAGLARRAARRVPGARAPLDPPSRPPRRRGAAPHARRRLRVLPDLDARRAARRVHHLERPRRRPGEGRGSARRARAHAGLGAGALRRALRLARRQAGRVPPLRRRRRARQPLRHGARDLHGAAPGRRAAARHAKRHAAALRRGRDARPALRGRQRDQQALLGGPARRGSA